MINDYLRLMKPHVIWLLVLSAIVGYIAAAPSINLVKLVELTVVGFLSTGGSAAFNMYYERDIDSLMTRTMRRPIPSGRVNPQGALSFSMAISLIGFTLSYVWLGVWVTLMVALGWFFYVVLYTIMLKRRPRPLRRLHSGHDNEDAGQGGRQGHHNSERDGLR